MIVLVFCIMVTIGGWFFVTTLLKDRSLTSKVEQVLEKSMARSGLEIKLGNLHYQGLNELVAKQIVIRDREDGSIPIKTSQIKLRFNPLLLMKDPTHPETALREIQLEKPILKLVRTASGWNFQKYFPKSKKQSMLWQTKLRIRQATLDYEDYQHGKYHLSEVNGTVSLRNNPIISWDLEGKSNFSKGATIQSRGESRMDHPQGDMVVNAANLAVTKVEKLLPKAFPYQSLSGTVDGQLYFAWNKNQFWLEKGQAKLYKTEIKLPMINDQLLFKTLQTEFTPEYCKIAKAVVSYHHSDLELSGGIDLKRTLIQAEVRSNKVQLADLKRFLPKDLKLNFDGQAQANLKVVGSLHAPVLNGQVSLEHGSLEFAQEKVSKISGVIAVKQNKILVKRLNANWRQAAVAIVGTAGELFKPVLELKVQADNFNLEHLLNQQAPDFMIHTSAAGFKGQIIGELSKLKCEGRFTLGYLAYQQYLANNLQVNFLWDNETGNLKISDLSGQICGGNLLANGDLFLNQQGAKWLLAGKASNIDLESFPLQPKWLAKGRVNGDAIIKGTWVKGQPFNLGSIIGNFQANGLSYQEIFSEKANGTYSYNQGKLVLSSIELQLGEGRLGGELSLENNQLALQANAEKVSLKRLLVEKNIYPAEGFFSGELDFSGSIPELSGRIKGVITKATWTEKEIGTIYGDFNYLQNSLSINELKIANEIGDFEVKGSVALDKEDSKLKLSVLSSNTKLKGILKWLPVDPNMQIDGFAQIQVELDGSLANLSYHGSSQLQKLNLVGLNLSQGELNFHGDTHEISLDKLLLTEKEARIVMTGTVEHDNIAMQVSGEGIQLDSFGLKFEKNSLSGKIDFSGTLAGKTSSPQMTAVLKGQQICFGTMSYPEMTAKLDWDATRLSISEAQLSGANSEVSVYGQIYTSKPYKLDVGINVNSYELADLMSLINLPNLKATGDLTGWIRLTGTSSNPSVRILGDLNQGSINQVPFKGEFDLFYNRNKIIFEKIELKQNAGSIIAKGSWENNEILKLDTKIRGLVLENFNTFFKKNNLEISGTTDAEISLMIDKEQITGKYVLDGKELNLNKNYLGNLHGVGYFSEGGITIQEADLFGKSGKLTADGYVAWPIEILRQLKLPLEEAKTVHETNLRLIAQSLSAQVSNGFANNLFKVTNGIFDGEVWLKGDVNEPDLLGKLNLTGVKGKITNLPLPLDDLHGAVVLKGKQIQFQDTQAKYGKGKIDLQGTLTLAKENNFGFDLKLKGTNFYYRNTLFDGFIDAQIHLGGDFKKSLVSGDLTTYNCRIGFLGLPQAAEKPTWIPEFDLKINTGLNTRFRQPGFADVILDGKLKVAGDLLSPTLEGEVNSEEGMLTFYGQTFKVSRAKAIFKSNESFDPYLEVDSNVFVKEAQIFMNIKGQLSSQPAIVLSSQPYLSQTEIYSLLNWSELRGDKQLTMNGVVAGNISLLTDSIFGDLLYQVRRVLNADYLYVEPDLEQKEFRFRVGYSLSDRFFLSMSRTMNMEKETENRWNDKWNIDYHLSSNWNVGATYTQEEGAAWRLSYQINL